VQPSRGWRSLGLRDVWESRELVYFLTWRDVKVRYRQTLLGAAWALIQPLFTMLVFALIFGRLAGMPSDGVPYPLFALTALVPWTFFASGVLHGSSSLVGGSELLRKVYFPRLVIPTAGTLAGLLDFALALLVLGVFVGVYGVVPGPRLLLLPAFVAVLVAATLGVTLWLSALNARYRDVRYAVPFLIQFWMFSTPVAYPASLLSPAWHGLYALNPMVGVVEGFRSCVLGTGALSVADTLVSVGVAVAVLASGAFYFRQLEKTIADVV
jgi:lipopolysaccharide transport system permease protein